MALTLKPLSATQFEVQYVYVLQGGQVVVERRSLFWKEVSGVGEVSNDEPEYLTLAKHPKCRMYLVEGAYYVVLEKYTTLRNAWYRRKVING